MATEIAPERVLALEWFEAEPGSWVLRLGADTDGLSAVVLEVPTEERGWTGVRSDALVWSVDQSQGERRVLGRFDRGWGVAALSAGTELARFNGDLPGAPAEVAIAEGPRTIELASIAGPRGSARVALAELPDLPPVAGEPLPGLTGDQRDAFEAGRLEFDRFLTERDGLGPSFNGQSCFACHFGPASGGFSERRVVHFASSAAGGRSFPEFGGPVLQERGIHPAAEESIPPEADVQAIRISPHVFGSGLVDALEDATLSALAAVQPPDVRGRVHWIPGSGGAAQRAGRFGWKAQSADLLHFTAEAALEELGQTNRLFPEELHPGGDRRVTELYDRVPDPEIVPDEDGRDRLDRLVDFQRLLAPPPQTPAAGHAGEALFERTGCAVCHTPRLVTGDGRRFAPYSDFLLHDLGDQGDGIRTGSAAPSEMRTAPLWGLTGRRFLWHDGALALEPF
ncbi:MAG: di-heme oxidoredictase family protein, partial [Planctomycetota bacterium]